MNSISPQRGRLMPIPRWTRLVVLVCLLAALAACTAVSPVKSFVKGEEIAYYDFSAPATFEEGSYKDGQVMLEIREGAYHIDLTEGDSEMWYGQWGDTISDVVIDVETKQNTESQNTVYGVSCRMRGTVGQLVDKPDANLQTLATESGNELLANAVESLVGGASSTPTAGATVKPTSEATQEATEEATSEATPEATPAAAFSGEDVAGTSSINNGDGYLFLIRGDGSFAIMRSLGRSLTPLVDWRGSGAIKPGAAQNRIRAVCMGTYLAMYVNGEFMADTSDDSYTQGQIGLVASATGRLGEQVQFDNLSVSQAKPG